HQKFLQIAFVHHGDFLCANAFIVHGISAKQRRAMKIPGAGIIDDAHRRRQPARADSAAPVALPTEAAQHLLDYRLKCERRARTIHRGTKYLRKKWRRGARFKEHWSRIVLRGRRRAQRHQLACRNVKTLADSVDTWQIGGLWRVRSVE